MLEREIGLDRIGLAALHGTERPVQQAGIGGKSRFRPAYAVGALVQWRRVQRGEGAQALAPGIPGPCRQQQPALAAERAQKGVDEIGRARDHEGLTVARAHPASMPDDLRRCRSQAARQLRDHAGGHIAAAFGPLRGIGAHEVRQDGKILDVALHIGGIIELFTDQHMQHGQIERQIRPRTDADALLRLEPGHRGTDIHAGHAAPRLQSVQHLIEFRDLERFQQVPSLHHQVAAIFIIVDPLAASVARQGKRGLIDIMGAGIIVGAVIGRAQAAQQRLAHIRKRPGPFGPEQAAGTIGGHDLFQTVRHIVQGFVPAHGTPFARPALARADQRPLRALIIGIQGQGRSSPRTQRRPVRAVAVAAYPAWHAILAVDLHRTARIAHTAQGINRG